MKKLLWLLVITVISIPALANQRYQGVCAQSGNTITSGLTSTTTSLRTYLGATVTVNVVGGGIATIFSDNIGTPLANPFTASSSDATFSFYAANSASTRYTVTCSGTGIPTISVNPDVLLFDPAVATFGSGAFSGNVTVGGTLVVTGASTLSSLTVTGASTLAAVTATSINSEQWVTTLTNAAINAAIQALPASGGVIRLIAGTYVCTNSGAGQLILIDRPVTFVGAGERSTILQVAAGIANTVPVVRIKPASSSILLQDGWQFRDIDFESASGVTAGDVFLMDGSVAATTGPANVEFDHVYIQQSNWGGRGINTSTGASSNMWNWDIHDSTISNGILLDSGTADTIKIIGNALSGPNAAVEVTSQVGASHLIVAFNNITNTGGAVVAHGTTQPKILYNQIEQINASTATNNAMIDLWGNSYTIDGAEIIGNNLNAHGNVTTNIQVNGATNTRIEGNVITLKAVTGVGINVTATAATTEIGKNTFVGAGGGAVEVQDAATAGANATQFMGSTDTQHEALRVLGTNSAANSAVIRGASGQGAPIFAVQNSAASQLWALGPFGDIEMTETAPGNWGGLANKDVLAADNVAHRWMMSNNNGTKDTVAGLADFAAPPAIGNTTPAAGHFTTASATGQITSTLATGTAPLVIASTTPVANLTVSNCGATCAITQPTISTGVSQGSGHKHQRFGGLCTTAAAAGATCTTAVTWTAAFADANYTVNCTGITQVNTATGPTVEAKAGAGFTLRIMAVTAAASSFTTVDCIADHD